MGAYGPAPREEARLTSGMAELLGILSPHALHPDGEWSFAEGPRRMLIGGPGRRARVPVLCSSSRDWNHFAQSCSASWG